jgi:DnaJ like chaperone protein
VIGKLIQMLVLAGIVWFVWQQLQRWMAQADAAARPRVPTPSGSPYVVLGVREGASQDEVRAAYQALVQQYHPDRVATMAAEFRDLAERKTKEINAAYAAIKKTWS